MSSPLRVNLGPTVPFAAAEAIGQISQKSVQPSIVMWQLLWASQPKTNDRGKRDDNGLNLITRLASKKQGWCPQPDSHQQPGV